MLFASLVRKVVHPLSEYVKSVRDRRASLSVPGGRGAWARGRRLGKYVSLDHPNNMKLNGSKARRIVREKRKGHPTDAGTASAMGVSVRWARKLRARHMARDVADISHPAPMGRPEAGLPGRREHSAVVSAGQVWHAGAAALQARIRADTGINVPHGAMHGTPMDEGMAGMHPKKGGRRKWVRHGRGHPDSPWHTDWKQVRGGTRDGRRFPCHGDDAPGFVTGYGMSDGATTANAPGVPEGAIGRHGKPAAAMADHGSQSCANEKGARERGAGLSGREPAGPGMRQVLAGVGHPQTNGKPEGPRGETRRKLHGSGETMTGKSDPTGLFMEWHDNQRPHMSLDWEGQETPAQAFARKMPEPGETTTDGQTGEEYNAA